MHKIKFSEKLVKGRIAYDRIADLQNQIINCTADEICVIIKNPGERLGRTFVFLIGCLILLANEHDKNIKIIADAPIFKQLGNLDIVSYFSAPSTKLQRFRRLQKKEDVFTLVPEIINEAPITMSEELEEAIVSVVGEMYNNAIDHSTAQFILGGKYFKGAENQHKRFCFSCYDTGCGISTNIRKFLGKDSVSLPDNEALEWAIKRGNTTKPGISRGLGIDLLIQLARANDGVVRICSGHTLFEYSLKKGERYSNLDNNFLGTLFEMDIIDDKFSKYI